MLTLNSSTFFVADMVIPFGRYGLFMWPMWSWEIWFVEDMVVADMVCGRYGTDPLTSCMRISHCRPSLTYFIIYLEAEFRGPLTEMLAIATHSTSYFFGTKAIRSAAYIGFRIIIITVNVYSAFFVKEPQTRCVC